MSDHLDSPGLKSPGMDPRVDITDLYAFQKPGDATKSILILNVNPLAPTLATSFDPDAIYEVLIDNNGDAVPEVAYQVTFSPFQNGAQTATLAVQTGASAAGTQLGPVILTGAPVSFGSATQISTTGDYAFYAGFRSDPFFFDLMGFLNGFKFTGDDFFKDKNVFGIVVQVPNSALSPTPKIGVWARVLIPGSGGAMTQIDRVGRPAINTVFNHGDDKNTFNAIDPTQDRPLFLDKFIAVLESFGHAAADATAIANILLPDILTYDYSSTAGFLNGRQLADDVIDIELNLVSNGAVTTDKVGPHTDYLSSFPYLGTPHPAASVPLAATPSAAPKELAHRKSHRG